MLLCIPTSSVPSDVCYITCIDRARKRTIRKIEIWREHWFTPRT